MTPQDTQNLLNFKVLEDRRANAAKTVPDLQTPYLHLARPNEQTFHALDYEHSKKRIFFSSVEEVDYSVSESNRIKKIRYRHNQTFQDWFTNLNQKTHELSQRKTT